MSNRQEAKRQGFIDVSAKDARIAELEAELAAAKTVIVDLEFQLKESKKKPKKKKK